MTKLELIFKYLEGSYAPAGVIKWFSRKRERLNWRSPAKAIEDGDIDLVLTLARDLEDCSP